MTIRMTRALVPKKFLGNEGSLIYINKCEVRTMEV